MQKPNPTREMAECQQHYLQMEVQNQQDLWVWLDVCPHSQTMTAFDIDLGKYMVYALPCNQWSCRHCAVRKTRALACKTEAAKPNRLVTLTVDPKLYSNPRDAFDKTRRKLPDWVKRMRIRFGEYEYLRVTEVTKAGWPHYHMLARSPYIPFQVAKDEWFLLTGAIVVDIRQVKPKFSTYTYLLKYLTKMHHITWTGRHVSYSRDFFGKDNDPNYPSHQLELRKVHNCHPSAFLIEHAKGKEVTRVTPRSYDVDVPQSVLDRDREDCGELERPGVQTTFIDTNTPADVTISRPSRTEINEQLSRLNWDDKPE